MTSPASDQVPDDRLFFAERLPAGPDSESPSDTESRVVLDLETTSPLPLERLAYGWVRLPSKDILYYAAPKERVPDHDPFAPAGTVLPDPQTVVLPDEVSAADFAKANRDFYADLRPRPELSEMRVRAAADALLSKLSLPLKLTMLAAILLLVAGGVFAGMNTVAKRRIDATAKDVKEARARADMLASIDRMEAAGHSVFDALAVVNPSRPEGVEFSKVTFSTGRELALEGNASSAGLVTKMESDLRATGFLGAFPQPEIQSSGGRTRFRMRMSFTKWPAIADAATSAPVAEKGSPTEISAEPAAGAHEGRARFGGFRGERTR